MDFKTNQGKLLTKPINATHMQHIQALVKIHSYNRSDSKDAFVS